MVKVLELFSKNIMYQKVEVKEFNVLIDGKQLFEIPVKKQRRSI